MAEDRALARMGLGFPLLVGGHDHDPYDEIVDGCRIVKTGCDATKVVQTIKTPGLRSRTDTQACCDATPRKRLSRARGADMIWNLGHSFPVSPHRCRIVKEMRRHTGGLGDRTAV
jgi:hypothetical protein